MPDSQFQFTGLPHATPAPTSRSQPLPSLVPALPSAASNALHLRGCEKVVGQDGVDGNNNTHDDEGVRHCRSSAITIKQVGAGEGTGMREAVTGV